jgi:diguanylate cyclase (GGDEF)-like protein/PAS domain S-box-containing protein
MRTSRLLTKPLFRLGTIPRKALFLGGAIGLVIVAFAIQLVVDLRRESWTAATRAGGDIATSIAHDIDRSLQSYDLSLMSVITDLKTAGVMELPLDMRDRVLFDSSARAQYLGPIMVLDNKGTLYIDSSSRVPPRESFATWEFFKFHQSHDDAALHIGPPFRGADGAYRITLSRRFQLEDGGFAGVVLGTVELAYFEDLFKRIDLGGKSVMSLTMDDGRLLMRWPLRPNDIGRNLHGSRPFETMVEQRQGSLTANSAIDGVPRHYVFRHIGDQPILLAVAQSAESVDAGWLRRGLLIGFLTSLLLAGCGALALILHGELSRRADAETALFAQGERLQVTLESIGDGVLSTDNQGNVLYMNAVAERLSGWSAAEARGRPSNEVLHVTVNGGDRRTASPVELALSEGATASGLPVDVVLHRRERDGDGGAQSNIEESIAPIRNREGLLIGAVIVFRDVTESRAMAGRMSHLAQHDALTDLPNRVLLNARLTDAIERANRANRKVAVLFLDLDRFKNVNDSLGHRVGDQLLIGVARRLGTCVREVDTVSRQGGDEFIVLLPDLSDKQGPLRVAESILNHLAMPFTIDGQALSITTSIGIAIYPDDGATNVELTKNADAAMYLAKQSGRNVVRFFTSELGDVAQRRHHVEQRIAEGLKNNEFVLHFQPLCRAADGVPFGAEALVRWMQDGKVVPPADFIQIAEESGQIIELGDAILTMACRRAVEWNRGRREPFAVSVNVSAHQFRSSGFVDRIARTLVATGLDPRCLELEITESVLLHAVDQTETVLRELKMIGVSIALDDFGTGYSSLSYLSRLPVDRIKIDRSFIQNLETNARDRSIVRAVINLGSDLGLYVVAEGVETIEQRKILTALGCPELQGYLFGRPSPSFGVGLAADDGPLLGFDRDFPKGLSL